MTQCPQCKMRRVDCSDDTRQVLVVEDNRVTADVLQFYLERVGYNVAVAYDGAEALRMLDDGRFHLVVTDYSMPGMDGRELCLQMRRRDRYARAPVVMVTAKGPELDLPRLREELGLVEVFSKPFSPMALVRTVKSCLSHDRN